MEVSELTEVAEEFIDFYREILLVDNYFEIKVEAVEDDFICACKTGSSPLTWVIQLNPSRHSDVKDVQLSVIEGVLRVLFHGLETTDLAKRAEFQDGLISRLRDGISELLPSDVEEETE